MRSSGRLHNTISSPPCIEGYLNDVTMTYPISKRLQMTPAAAYKQRKSEMWIQEISHFFKESNE